MKKFLMASAASALVAGTAYAGGHGEVKIGVILGFTGPIEALTPAMADGAEFAMAEVSSSGAFLGGKTVAPVRADSTLVIRNITDLKKLTCPVAKEKAITFYAST